MSSICDTDEGTVGAEYDSRELGDGTTSGSCGRLWLAEVYQEQQLGWHNRWNTRVNLQRNIFNSGTREGKMHNLKEGNINRHNILLKLRTTTTITFLKMRVIKEKTLYGPNKKLIFT